MELANLRKAFLPSKDRYASPHTEAMRVRKTPNKTLAHFKVLRP